MVSNQKTRFTAIKIEASWILRMIFKFISSPRVFAANVWASDSQEAVDQLGLVNKDTWIQRVLPAQSEQNAQGINYTLLSAGEEVDLPKNSTILIWTEYLLIEKDKVTKVTEEYELISWSEKEQAFWYHDGSEIFDFDFRDYTKVWYKILN